MIIINIRRPTIIKNRTQHLVWRKTNHQCRHTLQEEKDYLSRDIVWKVGMDMKKKQGEVEMGYNN